MLMGLILLSINLIKRAFDFLKSKSYPQSYSLLKMYPPVFALDRLNFNQPYAPLNGSVLTADNSKTKTNTNANHPTPKQKNQ